MEAGASSLQGDSWMKGHERIPARPQVLSRKEQEALPPWKKASPYTAASWVQIQGGCGGLGPLPMGPLQHRRTHRQPYPRSIYQTPPHRGCRAQPLDSNQPASPRPLRPNRGAAAGEPRPQAADGRSGFPASPPSHQPHPAPSTCTTQGRALWEEQVLPSPQPPCARKVREGANRVT